MLKYPTHCSKLSHSETGDRIHFPKTDGFLSYFFPSSTSVNLWSSKYHLNGNVKYKQTTSWHLTPCKIKLALQHVATEKPYAAVGENQ